MPTPATLERFIARVEENIHAEAIDKFYTENASMQENQGEPRVGRAALMAGEARVLARAKAVRSQCVRPVLVDGERIAQETFFYDPAQRQACRPRA